MKFRPYTLFILLPLILAGCTTGGVETPIAQQHRVLLKWDYNIDLVEVNAKNMMHLSMGLKEHPFLYLEPGKHTIVLQYSAFRDIDSENYVKFVSNPVTVELNARGGDVYEVVHEGPEEVSRRPHTMNKTVPIKVIKVNAGTGPKTPQKPAEPAVQTPIDQTTEVKKPKAPPAEAPAPLLAPEASSVDKKLPSALPLLKHWWKQATPAEKNAFKEWVGPDLKTK